MPAHRGSATNLQRHLSSHSTRSDSEDMIFFKGDDAIPLWDEAAPSAERSMSAVDVELCDSYIHVVIRKDKNGEPFCVTTHSSGGSDSGFGGSGNSGGSDGGSGIGGGGGGGSGSSGGSSGGSTGDNNSGSDNNSDSGSNNSNNNGNGDGDGDGDGTNTNGDDNSNNNSGNNSDRFNNVESKIDPFKNFVIDNPPTLEDERKPDINLGDKTKFAGYGMNGKTDCLVLCKTICDNYNISNYGSSANVFKLMHEVNGVLQHYGNNVAQNYKNAIDCIDRHLKAGRPIIVGVNYFIGREINEGTTDHFVVIYGRGYDCGTGHYYYNYYEVGRRVEYGYDDSANRFIYDPSDPPYFYDPISNHVGNMRYDVIQVRPNDGNTEGTIPQNSK